MASRPPPRRRASATTAARPASAAASPASRVLAAVCSPPAYPIATALAATLDISDADSAARALLTAAGAEPHLFGVLRALIAHEFTAHAAHPAQIGRAHSLVSRALGQHARRVGGPYLREVLGPLVGELAAAPRALEVDPARMPDDHAAGELTDNVAALADWLGRCTDALTSARSLAALPTQMRAVLAEMGRHADAAQMERGLRTALFGGYLILRFVNPAIVAPESHGLLATPPSLPARTSLKYAAKLLQAAANGSLPPEEAFVPLHETIRAAQPRIAAFLVTCADEPAASMLTRTTTRTDGGGEAASDEAASGEAASGEAAGGVSATEAAVAAAAAAEASFASSPREREEAGRVLAKLCVRNESRLRGALAAEDATELFGALDALRAEAQHAQQPLRCESVKGGEAAREAGRGGRSRRPSITHAAAVARAAIVSAISEGRPQSAGASSAGAGAAELCCGGTAGSAAPRSRRFLAFDRLARRPSNGGGGSSGGGSSLAIRLRKSMARSSRSSAGLAASAPESARPVWSTAESMASSHSSSVDIL